jgi:hypothetical protein
MRSMTGRAVAALALLAVVGAGCGSDDSIGVSFATPRDGDTVSSPVSVEMEAEGFVVEPAANGVNDGKGHLHIMVDTPCVEARLTVPPDDQHLHFGKGQTSAILDLEPGEHFLCLQAADGAHKALEYIDEIVVTVE